MNNKEALLSEEEYNTFVINVATGKNDDLFEEYTEEFR